MRPYTPSELEAFILLEQGLTQRQIARKLGVSESAISQRLKRLAMRHNLARSAFRPPRRIRVRCYSLSTCFNL
jgi:DNA-binding NarL/FixJ family response regulator